MPFDADQWRKLTEDKHIWVVGGGEVATLFLQEGLIDQLILTVIPTKIGSGKTLFASGFNPAQWNLQESKSWPNGVIQNTYSLARP